MKMLRENRLCVVVAKEPALVKFVDSIPEISVRSRVENAAIKLSRKILNRGFWTNDSTRQEMASKFVDLLVEGTSLDPNPSKTEQEQQIFSQAKREELQRLAREEAKAERAAEKVRLDAIKKKALEAKAQPK